MTDFEPWVKYPALTRKNLSVVAVTMRDVRDTAVLLHDPDAGDNAWSLGCRVYARTCFTLRRSAGQFDWLSVLQENEALRFTFAVGGVPLKFYRWGHCKPTLISEAEAEAKQLLLDLGEIRDSDRLLRLVVAAGVDGRTLSVTLHELDKAGKLTGKYVIPFDARADTLPALPAAVDQGPPPIQPLQTDTGKQEKRREGNVE